MCLGLLLLLLLLLVVEGERIRVWLGREGKLVLEGWRHCVLDATAILIEIVMMIIVEVWAYGAIGFHAVTASRIHDLRQDEIFTNGNR